MSECLKVTEPESRLPYLMSSGKTRGHWRRHAIFLGVALLVVLLDQASKQAVRSFMDLREYYPNNDWPIRFHYVTNTGAAFGILQDQTAFLAITSIIGASAIIFYYWTQTTNHPLAPIAIGMMLGGAAGNLIDRVRLGEVTDFIDLPNYPSFNLADSSIVIAVIALIAIYVIDTPKENREDAGAAARDPDPPTGS